MSTAVTNKKLIPYLNTSNGWDFDTETYQQLFFFTITVLSVWAAAMTSWNKTAASLKPPQETQPSWTPLSRGRQVPGPLVRGVTSQDSLSEYSAYTLVLIIQQYINAGLDLKQNGVPVPLYMKKLVMADIHSWYLVTLDDTLCILNDFVFNIDTQ